MTKLRVFIVQAEAEDRLAHNREPWRGRLHYRKAQLIHGTFGSGIRLMAPPPPLVRLVVRRLLARRMSRLFMCLLRLHLLWRLTRPRALFVVLLFPPGILGRETVCIVLVRYRWWMPSRQLCPYFPVTLTRIWKINFVGFSLCRRQCRLCLLMLLWGWWSRRRAIRRWLCPSCPRHRCLPAGTGR